MKHHDTELGRLTESLLGVAGIEIAPELVRVMLRHLEWLLETNGSINLTAVTDIHDAVRLHLVDSLLALPEVSESPAGMLVDLGTGGGFPGVELALADNRQALLIDSVKKKCEALSGFLVHENLATRISVNSVRAEDLATSQPACATVVTARALSSLPSLVELASPLLERGGRLIALKARPTEQELQAGNTAAALCGMTRLGVRTVSLPGGTETRTIVTYERSRDAKVRLPRRMGLAQKRPLA